jgi:putative flippase GtrA
MGRWLTFNGVGALGFVLQLGLLWGLVRVLGVHYVWATLIAVEAAILHNFVWHQRCTWRDRPSAGRDGTRQRLIRFHLLNGSVSLVGNLGLMLILSGALGLDPIRANVIAVIACSIVNFVGSDALVFRTAALVLLLLVTPAAADRPYAAGAAAAELQPQTLAAWEAYARQVDARYQKEPAFAHDAFGRDRRWRDVARGGAIDMFEADRPSPGVQPVAVPDGTIHHWVGAVFIPGATLADVLQDLKQNAGKESRSYEDVVDSRLLDRSGERLRVFLKIRRESALVTVHYNTEHEVEYRPLNATHATSRSVATKIAELADAGTPREREKKPGEDYGFLWRLNAYWRYEQVQGGVFIECESISLSRGIPFALRLFVTRSVKGIARESLEKTLRGLRSTLAAS